MEMHVTVYVQTMVSNIYKKNPQASFLEASRECSQRWNALAKTDKKEFYDMAVLDEARYESECIEYARDCFERGSESRTETTTDTSRSRIEFPDMTVADQVRSAHFRVTDEIRAETTRKLLATTSENDAKTATLRVVKKSRWLAHRRERGRALVFEAITMQHLKINKFLKQCILNPPRGKVCVAPFNTIGCYEFLAGFAASGGGANMNGSNRKNRRKDASPHSVQLLRTTRILEAVETWLESHRSNSQTNVRNLPSLFVLKGLAENSISAGVVEGTMEQNSSGAKEADGGASEVNKPKKRKRKLPCTKYSLVDAPAGLESMRKCGRPRNVSPEEQTSSERLEPRKKRGRPCEEDALGSVKVTKDTTMIGGDTRREIHDDAPVAVVGHLKSTAAVERHGMSGGRSGKEGERSGKESDKEPTRMEIADTLKSCSIM